MRMAAVAVAFVILITAVAGTKHTGKIGVSCPDMACVEKVIQQASASPYTRRLRVFDENPGFNPSSNATSMPAPLLDLTFD